MAPISRSYSREGTDGSASWTVEICARAGRAFGLAILLMAILAAGAFAQAPPDPALARKLAAAAIERTTHQVRYDPKYVRIAYPGGDVPADTGVCTDEIIRIYRAVGIDLQQLVHEDIVANPNLYPKRGTRFHRGPDSNIDHRRVPNLTVFFSRKGQVLTKSLNSEDYLPSDIVTWDLGGGVDHIGMVVDRRGPSGRYMVVHNIGAGPRMEDVLLNWRITGHYRYPASSSSASSAVH